MIYLGSSESRKRLDKYPAWKSAKRSKTKQDDSRTRTKAREKQRTISEAVPPNSDL